MYDARKAWWVACFLTMLATFALRAETANAGTVAGGRFDWTALSQAGFDGGGGFFSMTMTGPGTLVVTVTISPYYARENSSSLDGLLSYDRDGWQRTAEETLYDGKPSEAYASPPQPNGSIAVYRSRVEFAVPAQTFERVFRVIEPKKCGLDNCFRRAASLAFSAEFFPQGKPVRPVGAGTPDAGAPGKGGIADADGLEQGYDRPGSDIDCLFPIPNAKLCQSMCNDNGDCVAFTWVRPNVNMRAPWNGRPICCLKNAVPPPQASRCCVSGLR